MKTLKIVFVLAIMFAAILVPVYAQSDSIEIKGTSPQIGFANIDWEQQTGQGETFDLYNIRWAKGTALGSDYANSWIKQPNYYLRELAPGPWTFQVCLSKNKIVDESSCGNIITVNVNGISNEKLFLTGSNNEPSYANMDWNDVIGLGTSFDKYNVRWSKGNSLDHNPANSWISFGSYYNLGNLEEGPWTFQVCLSENKNVFENTCSNIVTVDVKGKYTEKLILEGLNNEPGFANMDWNDLNGLGDRFDKYNVQWNKGTTLKQDHRNAWVSFGSYYNLGNLEEGPYTFQVCLSKNKQTVNNVCSNLKTIDVTSYPVEYIEDTIISPDQSIPTTESNYIVWTRSNDQTHQAIVAKYVLSQGTWTLKEKVKSTLQDAIVVSPTESFPAQRYRADVNLKNGEVATFVAFDTETTIPSTLNVKQLNAAKGYVMNFQGVAQKDGKVHVCSYEKGCQEDYGSHAEEMVFFESGNFLTIYDKENSIATIATKEINPNIEYATAISELVSVCNNGCSYNDKCLPIGTRIRNGEDKFCNLDETMQPQLRLGLSCQNDYECSTNSCLSGVCTDLSGELQEQSNLLERILGWLTGRTR